MRGPSSRPTLSPVGIPGLAFALSPAACPEQRLFHTRVPMSRAFSDSEASGLRGQGLCRVSHKQPRPWLAWENEGPGPGTRREGPMGWGRPGISRAFGGQCGEPGRSRRARPAAQGSLTPWAWGGEGGQAKLQLAGNRGWFPVWKGRGPQRGAGAAADRHTPAFLPPSSPFCWKSEVIVSRGGGGRSGWMGPPSSKRWPWGLGRIYPFVPLPGLTFPSPHFHRSSSSN